ncbi:5'-_3' exoribonuclease, putative [Entamoeba invadens IP1]|uniref:5'->3' exoribonuclease, putative n=1 Tax=Entamoeba invadens IP1 TaxID=370355 RepID=A0A0A1TY07_ENTIV|nr:5'->3' exoribonuclease, putative [Entamoeba invadens IP1]ELP86283.1 5'->3' exoribonuclease, putative [Entamoeba invadens IP1]|eukprot:XP_004185629.1 5'-_3' exoribonuclease, putative [Entamoeba invadens IP1]
MDQGSDKTDHTDLDSPNLNGFEIDNFYLDMNGLIHPCFHPQDRPAPDTIDDMLIMLKRYLDYIIDIVRPRKLVYMAVDGVAPRAKMNQQRARRFKAARDKKSAMDFEAQQAADALAKGTPLPASKKEMDSNCITPGTVFMDRVIETLKAYVKERISTSAYWKKLVVIISDSSVPGEGEHKIMEYIRKQKDQPNYNPNLNHCIYGLDADLIMLTLATHERNFFVIREDVLNTKCYICGGAHPVAFCPKKNEINPMDPINKPFVFVSILDVRKLIYLLGMVPGYDFERIIDDFIFLCFFIGNDFLPHSPSLEIYHEDISLIMELYKEFLLKNGYVTDAGNLDMAAFKNLLTFLSRNESGRLIDVANKKRMETTISSNHVFRKQLSAIAEAKANKQTEEFEKLTKEFTESKLKFNEMIFGGDVEYDKPGYEERYYNSKLHIDIVKEPKKVEELVHEYVKGLVWVLKYYYQGCKGWGWFFPHNYAPFITDMAKYFDYTWNITFDFEEPSTPVEQLMSVLPPFSKKCVPKSCRALLNSETSPLKEFYPETFQIDFDGYAVEYLGVVLLPFIERPKLLKYLRPIEDAFVGDDKERNKASGVAHIYFYRNNPLFKNIGQAYTKDPIKHLNHLKDLDKLYKGKFSLDKFDEDEVFPLSCNMHEIAGTVFPVKTTYNDVIGDCVVCGFENPEYDEKHIFIPRYLEGQKLTVLPMQKSNKSTERNAKEYMELVEKSYCGEISMDYTPKKREGPQPTVNYEMFLKVRKDSKKRPLVNPFLQEHFDLERKHKFD